MLAVTNAPVRPAAKAVVKEDAAAAAIDNNTKTVTKETDYWNNFYGKFDVAVPSQFCTMFATEANRKAPVVEFGCGNGRDSIYLARQGFKVFAGDLSEEAVAKNQAKEEPHSKREGGGNTVSFNLCDVANAKDVESLLHLARDDNAGDSDDPADCNNVTIYNRFFLHSLDDEQERLFLTALSDATLPGDTLYMEYRCSLDEALDKVYGKDHYRRYVDTQKLMDFLSKELKFDIKYEVTGQGMAKYKSEDPFVSRIIATRR